MAWTLMDRCLVTKRKPSLRVAVVLGLAVGLAVSGATLVTAQQETAKELDAATWKLLDVGTDQAVVAIAIDHDGQVQVFKSENFTGDKSSYDMADVKMVSIAVTIGGTTRVCWITSSGQEQCEPPR